MTGDLLHLLSLGVALNLGFGALVSFADPGLRRLNRNFDRVSVSYERAVLAQDTDADVENLFAVGTEYLRIRHIYTAKMRELTIIHSPIVLVLAILLAGIGFFAMIICTQFPKLEVGSYVVVFCALLSVVPIGAATAYFVVSETMRKIIEPQLDKILLLTANSTLDRGVAVE